MRKGIRDRGDVIPVGKECWELCSSSLRIECIDSGTPTGPMNKDTYWSRHHTLSHFDPPSHSINNSQQKKERRKKAKADTNQTIATCHGDSL